MKAWPLLPMLLLCAGIVRAEFPEKPITVIVPFTAGGPTDKVARPFAEALSKRLGKGSAVVIDNTAGAGGTLGATKAARARNDGHTLLLTHIGMATAPALYRNLAFNPLEDFEYLGLVSDAPMTLVARSTLPAKDFSELQRWIQANKSKVTLANAGIGSASHLCGLLLQGMLKVDMTAVPYKGAGPAMIDLQGGQVDLLCDQSTNTTVHIEAGTIKAYAVTTAKRLSTPALSKLPTLNELGLQGFEVSIWHGVYAPKGTPKAVLDKLQAAVKQATQDAEFIKSQESVGALVIHDARNNGPEHKKYVAAEIGKWGPIIRANAQYAD